MKLCVLVPNSYIHVSVSDLYIPRISLPIVLQRINTCGNWETEHFNSALEITRPAQFHCWGYINQNQTFMLDSHRLFICSVDFAFKKEIPPPLIETEGLF